MLESTFERLFKTIPMPLQTESQLKRHLENFKHAIRGRRGQAPKTLQSDEEYWALGQHYGLATPLLDWSFSPYIATFFAFKSSDEPLSGRRALFALNLPKVRDKSEIIRDEYLKNKSAYKEKHGHTIETLRSPIIEFVDPLLDDSPRIINQSGIFTRSPIFFSIEYWIEHYCQDENEPVLYKITLPDAKREIVLLSLYQMNINSLSLFPDMHGSCLFCNEMMSLRYGNMARTLMPSLMWF